MLYHKFQVQLCSIMRLFGCCIHFRPLSGTNKGEISGTVALPRGFWYHMGDDVNDELFHTCDFCVTFVALKLQFQIACVN